MKSQVSARPLALKLIVTAMMGSGLLSSASVWAQAAAEKTEPTDPATVVVTGVKASLFDFKVPPGVQVVAGVGQ